VRGSKRLIDGTPSRGVYELRVYRGRDETGRKSWVSRTHRGGVKSSDDALRDLVKEVETGRHRGPGMTLGSLCDKWIVALELEGRSPTTLREYRRIIERVIKPALGAKSLEALKPHDLDDLYASLSKRGLSPSSVHQVHSILRASCKHAVRKGWLAANPAVNADPPKIRRAPPNVPTVAEVRRLIATAEDLGQTDMAAFIALAAFTGARRGELCALRWDDVDWAGETLTIGHSLAVMGRGEIVRKDTKTHQVRRIAIDGFGIEVLRRHRTILDERAEYLESSVTDSMPVFSHWASGSYDLDRPIAPDTVTHLVGSIADKAGVDTHLHALRHFAVTQLISQGVDVRTVAGRAGHADASVTLKVYAHVMPQRDREAAEQLGRALSS
jgi:integrase